jgi:hypothetical protein
MGKRQAKRAVSSGDKVWIVYYRYFEENSYGHTYGDKQIQVFTRREYAKRFIERLGIDTKFKIFKKDSWLPKKYYGYDEHEEYDDEDWTRRAAAVIIETTIDPLYNEPDPRNHNNNAYLTDVVNEVGDWGDGEGFYVVCPKCHLHHDYEDNFCPHCGYGFTREQAAETIMGGK